MGSEGQQVYWTNGSGSFDDPFTSVREGDRLVVGILEAAGFNLGPPSWKHLVSICQSKSIDALAVMFESNSSHMTSELPFHYRNIGGGYSARI